MGNEPTSPSSSGESAGGSKSSGAVPAPAVRRLSLYLRELESVRAKQKRKTISSKELGAVLGLTDAQVRKDLAYFGQFGHPGVGYRVDELIAKIRGILGTDRTWNVVVVGAGNLGNALLSYRGFSKKGFRLVAVLDNDPAKVGQPIRWEPGLSVQPFEQMAEVVATHHVQMAILCVPADVAQDVTDQLVQAGVRAILNFAPATLNVPDHVSLNTVDLATQLEQLAFRLCADDIAARQ